MASYRKKPVVVQAIQYNGAPDVVFCFMGAEDARRFLCNEEGQLYIATLEGWMEISNGDFVIRGVKGEYYPCKPDIFGLTSEEGDS